MRVKSIQMSELGEDYLKFHTARVRDVELLTGLSLFNRMAPLPRVKLVTYLSENLWQRSWWLDDVKTSAGQCPLNRTSVSCPPGSVSAIFVD